MVFGLFSKEKSLQKTIERATNKLAQQPDRWGALEKLKDDGSEEALLGLCRRFGVTCQKAVEDEQEKHWVVETLVGYGTRAVSMTERAQLDKQLADKKLDPAQHTAKMAELEAAAAATRASVLGSVTKYVRSAEHLSFPLRVLERIADHDNILKVADELFASETPGYVRMPERRIDLIHWFSEWKGATEDEAITRLARYVTDFDENSRFAAIQGMAGRDPAKIAPPLIEALLRPEEESGRIKRTIVEVLVKAKAPLGDKAQAVAGALAGPLADDFKVDGGVLKKR